MTMQTIFIHPAAPPKPPEGAPCNGCGVCCLAQPCPVGMLLSRRRRGACQALRWDAVQARYRCGAITEPRAVVLAALPHGLRWLAPVPAALLGRLARRWVAAGQGCDSDLLPQAPPPASTTMPS
ncbi:hypothetical protein C5F53_17595 [Rhodoferax sp. TS-BS-61-7]|nr:hypothetical protein C5F53_17595 [Rhodoferax sp. TS-BS-61-7]